MDYKPDMTLMPDEFRQAYERMSVPAKEKWLEDRYRALTDGMFLGCEVMGMDFQRTPHNSLFALMLRKEAGMKPLYDLDKKIKKRMILWPRGTFKTSSIIVEIIQLILNYPNIRICFLTGGDMLAKRQISRVLKFFNRPTQMFRNLFPEFCDMNKTLANSMQFTVPCRTNDTFAEPTMAISTAKSVKAGSHYDVIFVDDLVNETNYKNPKALQKSIDDYKDICPLLAPDGFMYVTGTRYSFGDLYEDIQRLAKEEQKQFGRNPWKMSILPCWVEACARCKHFDMFHDKDKNVAEPPCTKCACGGFKKSGTRDVLFPKFTCKDGRTEGHSVEFLDGEKFRMGAEFFANQYENNPIATGSQTFTPELLDQQTLFHESQFPSALVAPTFFVGDLSYVGDDKRDQSVIFVCRYMQGQIFVIDCIFGKWDSMAVAENLMKGMMKYRPTVIWLERFLGWEAYDTVFRAYCAQKEIQRMPVEWIPMSNVEGAKKIRIGSIKGVLAEKRLWIAAQFPSAPGAHEVLREQLMKWPKLGKHDDFADCLGLVCLVPTGYQLEKLPSSSEDSKSWLRKLHQKKESDNYDTRMPGSY